MKTAICQFCGEDYSAKRFELGYITCLDCGDSQAQKEKEYKAKCVAPYTNKGAYMLITNKEAVKGIFKCGSNK